MLCIPKIDGYLEVLTEKDVKYFVAINFSKYFKSIEKEQNLRKVAKSICFFLTTADQLQSSSLIIVYIAIMLKF